MEKYLDNMFDSLYGEDTDEYGEKYSKVYCYECENIIEDIKNNYQTISEYFGTVSCDDMAKIIVIAEQEHIGNDLTIDLSKLASVANDLCKYFE